MRHLKTLFELSPDDVRAIFDHAANLKAGMAQGKRPSLLENRVLTQIFEKPSLRTRLSFEAAMTQLGGDSSFFSGKDAGLYGRESVADIARVVSGMSDAVVLRTFEHQLVEDFAANCEVPVINGLSDDFHPCQALTDLFTIREAFGSLNGQKLVFVGDGNNVAVSLSILTAMLGLPMTLACPSGYEIPGERLAKVRELYPEASFTQTNDPVAAVRDADVIYTDVWASMGQEDEAEKRRREFADFQVNEALLRAAPKAARFMHDLPARRGLEVTDAVMDGPQSIVFQQAENRMHLAKGLLVWLLNDA